MKTKIILGSIVIVIAFIFLFFNFMESKIEYGNFSQAIETKSKIQVKGYYVKEKNKNYNTNKNEFNFFMKDDSGKILQVVFKGAEPNNFELAESIVVKGIYRDDIFYASDILTKCPSKYEGDSTSIKKTLQ